MTGLWREWVSSLVAHVGRPEEHAVTRVAHALGRLFRTIVQGIYDGIDWLTVGR